jgi:predicted enzyme related to lactoylglutathione lyase
MTQNDTETKNASTGTASKDAPKFFRLNIEVSGIDAAVSFYDELLGVEGRRQGSRCFYRCGPVTLQVVDVATTEHGNLPSDPHPNAKSLYFTTSNLEAVYERAKSLGCVAAEAVHGGPGGDIVVRRWGERSFYAKDPWNNSLCFVDEGTVYSG